MTTEPTNTLVEHLPYAKDLVTRLPHTESALRTTVMQAIGAASTCWDSLEGAGVFQPDRAAEVGNDLIDQVLELTGLGQPSLGCATTNELIAELATRVRMSALGEHRTVD